MNTPEITREAIPDMAPLQSAVQAAVRNGHAWDDVVLMLRHNDVPLVLNDVDEAGARSVIGRVSPAKKLGHATVVSSIGTDHKGEPFARLLYVPMPH